MRAAANAVAHERVITAAHAKSLTRPIDGGVRDRASLQFRALIRKPATPTPVVEVYAR